MIEEARIKKNLESFAFPRLSGTKFELKAFTKLKQIIENLNLKFEVQKFTFSSFYSRIYPKVAFLSVSLILIILYLNFFISFTLIIIYSLLAILILSIIITRKPENIQFPTFNSQNLLIKIKAKSNHVENKDRNMLFISHIDSKGQRFKVRIRIKIIKLWINTSLLLLLIFCLKNFLIIGFDLFFYIIGLFPLICNLYSSIIMLLNKTDNSSNGAIDNASGIACNLELVNYYNIPENRLQNYNLWFLFTGAEECGTMGIRHFYNNLENFDPNKSIIFNFESLATQVYLFPGGSEGEHARNVNQLLLNNKRNLQVRTFITKRIFGTHSDGGFLGDRGLQGYGIGGAETHAYMHTPQDTIEKIDTKILKKICLVLTDSLKEHDSKYFKNN